MDCNIFANWFIIFYVRKIHIITGFPQTLENLENLENMAFWGKLRENLETHLEKKITQGKYIVFARYSGKNYFW